MFLLDRRDDPSRLPRFQLSPEGLLGELHYAQAALAAAEHYVSLWRTKNKPFSAHCSCATQKALHDARNTIDRLVAMLGTQAATPPHDHADPSRPIDHQGIDGHAHRLRRGPNSRSRAKPDQQEGIVDPALTGQPPAATGQPTVATFSADGASPS
jgi:hypothetical protein